MSVESLVRNRLGGGGRYQDGFGWTNGVTLKMLDLICSQEKPCDSVPSTRPALKQRRQKRRLCSDAVTRVYSG